MFMKRVLQYYSGKEASFKTKPGNGPWKLLVNTFLLTSMIIVPAFLKSAEENVPVKLGKYQHTVTKPEIIIQLYQMLKDVHEILTASNIEYWIHFGTLMGAVRHKGIIPWDDDLDLCIWEHQEDKLISLGSLFKKLGYDLKRERWPGHLKVYKSATTFPYADIFVMGLNDSKVEFTSELCRKTWPTAYFSLEELYPLKNYKFGLFDVVGPAKPHPVLTRRYKASWFKKGIINSGHAGIKRKNITITLTDKERIPAQPLGPLEDRCAALKASNLSR